MPDIVRDYDIDGYLARGNKLIDLEMYEPQLSLIDRARRDPALRDRIARFVGFMALVDGAVAESGPLTEEYLRRLWALSATAPSTTAH